MKVNLTTISKRAQGILTNSQFQKSDLTSDFEVTLDSSDRILTVFHSGKAGEIELILSEALAVFAKNRTIADLWKINFREVENFLRDENHLPAFTESIPEMEKILNIRKISLIAEALKTKAGEEVYTLIEMIFDWRNLSLVAKNQWAMEFLNIIGSELIFCDGETLTFTKVPKDVPGSDLELLVQRILGGGEIVLPMKVVAV